MAKNTLIVSGGATLLAVIFGVFLSFLIFKIYNSTNKLFISLFCCAAVIPLTIYAASWLNYFDSSSINYFQTGNNNANYRILGIAILITGLSKIPLATILIGFSTFFSNPELEENAWLYTSRSGVLFHVILPRIFHGIIFASIIIFGISAGEIAVTDMLGVRSLAEEIYSQFQLAPSLTQTLFSTFIIFFPIIIFCGLILVFMFPIELINFDPVYRKQSIVFRTISRKYKFFFVFFAIIFSILFFGFPVLALLKPIKNFPQFLKNAAISFPYLIVSLKISLTAAFLSIFAGFPIAYFVRETKISKIFFLIIFIGIFVPRSVVGIILVHIFNRGFPFNLIYNSWIIVTLCQALRYFPITLLILNIFMQKVPTVYSEMSKIDQLTFFKRLWYVEIPICSKPITIAFFVAFLLSIGELDGSLIVCPPGVMTLPVHIFTMLHYGLESQVASACILLILAVFIITILSFFIIKKFLKR